MPRLARGFYFSQQCKNTAHSVDPGFDEIGYGHADCAQSSTSHDEAALWCAVIRQAFVDAGIILAKHVLGPKQGLEADRARRFLTGNSADFFLVCSLAGVNPDVIRKGAARIER